MPEADRTSPRGAARISSSENGPDGANETMKCRSSSSSSGGRHDGKSSPLFAPPGKKTKATKTESAPKAPDGPPPKIGTDGPDGQSNWSGW